MGDRPSIDLTSSLSTSPVSFLALLPTYLPYFKYIAIVNKSKTSKSLAPVQVCSALFSSHHLLSHTLTLGISCTSDDLILCSPCGTPQTDWLFAKQPLHTSNLFAASLSPLATKTPPSWPTRKI